jgi:hypothetical protein
LFVVVADVVVVVVVVKRYSLIMFWALNLIEYDYDFIKG